MKNWLLVVIFDQVAENAYEYPYPLGDYLQQTRCDLEAEKITIFEALDRLFEQAKMSSYHLSEKK